MHFFLKSLFRMDLNTPLLIGTIEKKESAKILANYF